MSSLSTGQRTSVERRATAWLTHIINGWIDHCRRRVYLASSFYVVDRRGMVRWSDRLEIVITKANQGATGSFLYGASSKNNPTSRMQIQHVASKPLIVHLEFFLPQGRSRLS